MTRAGVFATLPILLLSLGCSGGPTSLDSEDPAAYARTIRRQVQEFVQSAQRNPATVRESGAILLEELEAREGEPLGEYGPVYAQLTDACREVIQLAEKRASAASLRGKLRAMAALAAKLPGEDGTAAEADAEEADRPEI